MQAYLLPVILFASLAFAQGDLFDLAPVDSLQTPTVPSDSTTPVQAAKPDTTTQVDSVAQADSIPTSPANDPIAERPDVDSIPQPTPRVLLQSPESAIVTAPDTLGKQPSSPTPRSKRDLLGPVKVSRVNTINELKGRYKSPRKALFMSLVLPGAGQLYVGGKWNNARGGAYLATEALLIGLLYHYSVNQYGEQVDKYESFAKSHYSIGRYESAIYSLYKQIPDSDKKSVFSSLYLLERESYCQSLYSDPNFANCSSLPDATNHRLQFPDSESLGESMKKLDVWNKEDLFRILGGENYLLGWDDVTEASTYANLDLDSSGNWIALGKSSTRDDYLALRAKANEYADMQSYFLGGILLNHLISALDATLSAYAHNKSLYQEKVSWMQNLHLESGFSMGTTLSNGLNTRVAARLDF